MITQATIDKIFETARIEEVVADFVQMKRVGGNYRGLSPFTNEKTPSFYVSPAKQIYKCFSSGNGGNVVGFLMELEKMSYPEALRHLANRYGIEIEETQQSDEQKEQRSRRESLYLVNEFAAKVFAKQLLKGEEGVRIGLSYFKERGFTEKTIKDFELGYTLQQSDALLKEAQSAGHNIDLLKELGLIMENERGLYDRFRERVMFPIHNLSGRIAGFGGRTLRSDKKIAKYINSPESEIYNKSKLLYGLYQARKAVVKKDRAYLVEGYTDVISFHQAGVENTIATSGTSLTEDQVRQIKRLTNNVTILFDGDAAGIKASMRGIDMFLREGLHVHTLLFPDGEDPDSFARSRGAEELHRFLNEEVSDFLLFKTRYLLEEADGSPLKKAEAIREIARTLALMPNDVDRNVYVRESSKLLDTEENLLLGEVNRLRTTVTEKQYKRREKETPAIEVVHAPTKVGADLPLTYAQEEKLMELLLKYGEKAICFCIMDENGRPSEPSEEPELVAQYIVEELNADELTLQYPPFVSVYAEFQKAVLEGQTVMPGIKQFLRHEDQAVVKLVIDLTDERYELSDWEKKGIYPKSREVVLEREVRESVLRFKEKVLHGMIEEKKTAWRENNLDEDASMEMFREIYELSDMQRMIQRMLGQEV